MDKFSKGIKEGQTEVEGVTFIMRELIINYKERYLDIIKVSKTLNKIKIIKNIQFYPQDDYRGEGLLYNNVDNIDSIKKLLRENGIKDKSTRLILSMDGIITRLIEVPYMKKGDLDKYIQNNIEEYFTVGIDDYYFDYRIMDVEIDEKKKFNLLLAAVPKAVVNDVKGLLENAGIEIKKVDIYPNCIAKLFRGLKDIDTSILEIDNEGSKLTILTKNRIFLYSNINSQADEEDGFQELLNNLGYFLNFYSSRNFGKKLDSIYLLGELENNDILRKIIATQFDIEVYDGFKETKPNVTVPKDKSISQFAEVLGLLSRKRSIYNKDIDFKQAVKSEKKDSFKTVLISLTLILMIITAAWIAVASFYIRRGMAYYDTSQLDKNINELSYVEEQINSLSNIKKEYNDKYNFMQNISKDKFDYLSILDAFRRGIPENARIKSITMDSENVNVIFEITDGSTLDATRLTIAINKMDIFEPIEISNIKLDDTVNEVNYTLRLKKP